MKNRPMGAELFHAHGQKDEWTDTTKLVVAFRNFANPPKNGIIFTTRRRVKGENKEAQRTLLKKMKTATATSVCSINIGVWR